jgi:hypothetical protein
MFIGKIVKSDSHITYVCQIYGPREVEIEPGPPDYAFGRFVRVAVRSGQTDEAERALSLALGTRQEPITYAVGVIYDTILLNPAFGSLGPRLSNETQVELFSPDYISEKAVLIYVMVLGMIEVRPGASLEVLSVMHGVPLLSLELGSEIETMTDEEVRAFHYFSDPSPIVQDARRGAFPAPSNAVSYAEVNPVDLDGQKPYLHMGYLPHIIGQRNSLLPMVTLCIIDQLERLFPENLAVLSIVKRNFAWRLKVETTG